MIRSAAACLLVALAAAVGAAPGAAALEQFERRAMLTAEEHAAWHGVGRVNISTFSATGMCTGTLIAEDIVLTAAHCVISDRTGEVHAPGNVHFVAGYRRGVGVANSRAASITIHPSYRRNGAVDLRNIGADIALIRLSAPIPGSLVPHFRVAPAETATGPLTLVSYRRDRQHALTRQDGCDIRGAAPAVLALGCDVTFGASGSPVFAEVGGEVRLIAVVSAMSRQDGKPIAWAVRVDAAIAEVLAGLR